MIRAVIFDFDGLILDTESALLQAWRRCYAQWGQELPISLWAANIGGYSYEAFHPMDHLEQLVGHPLDREALTAQRRAWYWERVNNQETMSGVRQALADARRMGLLLGIASSSDRKWVAGHLARLGLLDLFDIIRCGDEVLRVKPDPELYRAVMDTMNVGVLEAFALEDSPKGVAAAKAASLYCVAVPNPVTAMLDLGAADRRLESLSDLSFTTLVAETEETLSRAL